MWHSVPLSLANDRAVAITIQLDAAIMLSRKSLKLIGAGILFGILLLISTRSSAVRNIILFCAAIVLAGICGGIVGAIVGTAIVGSIGILVAAGLWLRNRSKLVFTQREKQLRSSGLDLSSPFEMPQRRSVNSQLRAAAGYSRAERLQLIDELEMAIRRRSPNFSLQDLCDLSLLGRERQQVNDEATWSSMRQARVARIAQIRASRQANQRSLPTGLVDTASEPQDIPIDPHRQVYRYVNLDYYGALTDDDDGIGDLTCVYNAHSLFLRCAVNPGADTCEGCRDYQSARDERP